MHAREIRDKIKENERKKKRKGRDMRPRE